MKKYEFLSMILAVIFSIGAGIVTLMNVDIRILHWTLVASVMVLVNWRVSSLSLRGK